MAQRCLTSTAQVYFAERLLVFINELSSKMTPSLRQHSSELEVCRRFHIQIDASFEELERFGANDHEYRRTVCLIACDEVRDLCSLMREACMHTGFETVADRYLNSNRLVSIIYSANKKKLALLNALLHGWCEGIGELMMRIGAILDDQTNRYAALDSSAKRKATEDVMRIASAAEAIADGANALHLKSAHAISSRSPLRLDTGPLSS